MIWSHRARWSLTLSPARVSRCIVELQVDVAVLPGLSAVAAVAGHLVGLEVDLSAEGVRELLGAAAALLTQEVLLPKMLTQVGIVTGGAGIKGGRMAMGVRTMRVWAPTPDAFKPQRAGLDIMLPKSLPWFSLPGQTVYTHIFHSELGNTHTCIHTHVRTYSSPEHHRCRRSGRSNGPGAGA